MPLLEDILAKGYFPAELPPCFTTATFAAVCAFPNGTPQGFLKPAMAQLCNFSLAKAGNARFRRRLSLVNPVNFFHIATIVASNWTALERHMRTSTLSMSRAVYRPNGARALSHLSYSPANRVDRQAKDRGTAKALLVADISEFYHSIYTHSIPWALHTKPIAKANHTLHLLGQPLGSSDSKCPTRTDNWNSNRARYIACYCRIDPFLVRDEFTPTYTRSQRFPIHR